MPVTSFLTSWNSFKKAAKFAGASSLALFMVGDVRCTLSACPGSDRLGDGLRFDEVTVAVVEEIEDNVFSWEPMSAAEVGDAVAMVSVLNIDEAEDVVKGGLAQQGK